MGRETKCHFQHRMALQGRNLLEFRLWTGSLSCGPWYSTGSNSTGYSAFTRTGSCAYCWKLWRTPHTWRSPLSPSWVSTHIPAKAHHALPLKTSPGLSQEMLHTHCCSIKPSNCTVTPVHHKITMSARAETAHQMKQSLTALAMTCVYLWQFTPALSAVLHEYQPCNPHCCMVQFHRVSCISLHPDCCLQSTPGFRRWQEAEPGHMAQSEQQCKEGNRAFCLLVDNWSALQLNETRFVVSFPPFHHCPNRRWQGQITFPWDTASIFGLTKQH